MEKSEVSQVGRKKKYTPNTLRKAVSAYFHSITREVPLYDLVPSGEYTNKGKMLMERVEAKDQDGNTIKVREYIRPPSLSALCLMLGISRTTWAEYGRDEDMEDIVENARMEVETYWVEQLSGRNAQGAKFALQNACGWRGAWSEADKVEVELGPESRKAAAVQAMTLEEKLQLIQEAGAAMAKDLADGAED